jgi:hypothetical protein
MGQITFLVSAQTQAAEVSQRVLSQQLSPMRLFSFSVQDLLYFTKHQGGQRAYTAVRWYRLPQDFEYNPPAEFYVDQTIPLYLSWDDQFQMWRAEDKNGRAFFLPERTAQELSVSDNRNQFVFPVNPNRVQVRLAKLKSKRMTVGGIDHIFIGNEPAQMTLSGAFPIGLNFDGSTVALGQSDTTAEYYRAFLKLRDWFHYWQSLDTTSLVMLVIYQMEVYAVRFVELDYEEEAQKANMMNYVVNLIVEKMPNETALTEFYLQPPITIVNPIVRVGE